jgi:minor extracellular protease Epr
MRKSQRFIVVRRFKAPRSKPASARTRREPSWAPIGIHIVSRSQSEPAALVESNRRRIDELRRNDPSIRVFEERWYRLARTGRPALKVSTRGKPSRSFLARRLKVRVVLDDAKRTPLPDVRVTALLNAAAGRGDEAQTDHDGRAQLVIPRSAKLLEELDLDPLHGAWPKRLTQVAVADIELALTPIDLDQADARGLVYGMATEVGQRAVKVAVIDTGVGPHRALRVAIARNTSGQGKALSGDDFDGHGTHVAGVIGSIAQAWRRGEAADVELHAYRVFAKGREEASNFAIAEAVFRAARDGCDLINMSLGSELPDPYIRLAVETAWESGCVCVAAAGNDGRSQVDYPARYAQALAVSAIGLSGSWPDGARQALQETTLRGKAIGGKTSFIARFSNRGPKIALTAPGVGIVSTIFADRWGVMDGTSMAAPIATAVIARRLAVNQAVLTMPRDRHRSQKIRELAVQACEDIGLAHTLQGQGLAR